MFSANISVSPPGTRAREGMSGWADRGRACDPTARSEEFALPRSSFRLRRAFSFGFSIVLFQTQRPGGSFLSCSACCALAICPCRAVGPSGHPLSRAAPGHGHRARREAGASLRLPRSVTLGQDCHSAPLFPPQATASPLLRAPCRRLLTVNLVTAGEVARAAESRP